MSKSEMLMVERELREVETAFPVAHLLLSALDIAHAPGAEHCAEQVSLLIGSARATARRYWPADWTAREAMDLLAVLGILR